MLKITPFVLLLVSASPLAPAQSTAGGNDANEAVSDHILNTGALLGAIEWLPGGVLPPSIKIQQAPSGGGPKDHHKNLFTATANGDGTAGAIWLNSTHWNNQVNLFELVTGEPPSDLTQIQLMKIFFWHEFHHMPMGLTGLGSEAINDKCAELSLHMKTLEQLCEFYGEAVGAEKAFAKHMSELAYGKVSAHVNPTRAQCKEQNGGGAAGPPGYGIPDEFVDCSAETE